MLHGTVTLIEGPWRGANSHAGYHQFKGWHGSFEVFWNSWAPDDTMGDPNLAEGWYWWACFPGCLPDGEPSGPFATSQEAYDDAFDADAVDSEAATDEFERLNGRR